jgi:tetratricopeptide (TPR) repeat protein
LRKNQGRGLLSAGEAFYRELDRRQLLNAPSKALFEGALAFSQARWSDAQASFAKASNGDMGRWLSEEAAWMGFWAAGARGGIPASGQEYESSWLEITSRLRSALVSRDAKLMQLLPQIAVEDPLAYHLWFVSAQANWRVATDKVQLAQQFFVAGLATLSLYPVSVQAVYWEQFAEFLSGFGRQSTTERALHNRDAIRAGDVESPGKRGAWWDLGQEGLDMQVLAQDVLSRLASGVVKPSDLALLQVLGFVLPAGSGALTSAGYHWAFEDNWPRAEELFERALKVDAKNTLALGGLIWAHASRYEFDEALHYHDLLKSLPSETPEAEKFMSLIQMIAREPDNARNGFQAYLKTVPNDAWGHYFFALFHYGQQKNVDCLRSATLARQHAEGELKFRANLLFYRCRVLSGVDLSGALADLRKMAERESENIAVQIELVTALDNAGLRNDAILAARDVLGRFPRSYEMRVKLGELYEKNRNEDLAVGFYRKASVDRPGSAEGWVRIARIFENQKNWKEAAANYFTAAQAEPSYPEVWLMTARAYAKSGAYEDAARMYRREIEARPTVVTSFIEAAEFMLRINAPQEVPKIFQLFKEDFQGDPRVLTRLAQAYLAMGQVEQARNAAANAVQADPNLAEPHRILGTIFEKQSMFDPARKSFERYLTLLPQADDANLIRQKLSQPPYAGN